MSYHYGTEILKRRIEMKYCTNCGNPLDESVAFCPSCGQSVKASEATCEAAAEPAAEAAAEAVQAAEPVSEPAAPVKAKKRVKPGVIIAIVLAALLAIAAVLYFTGVFRKVLPASRAKLALAEKALVDNVLDETFDARDKSKDLFDKLDMTITAAIETNGSGGMFSTTGIIKSILEQVSLDLKIDGSEGTKIGVGVNYSGNALLDGRIFIDEDQVGLYVPQLDSKYYVMSADALAKLLNEADVTDADLESLDLENTDLAALLDFDEDKTRKEIYELLAIIGKISTEENTVIEKGVEFALFDGAQTVTADRYTITPTKEQVAAVIKELGEHLSNESSYLGGKIREIAKLGDTVDGEEFDPFKEIIDGADSAAEDFVKDNAKIVIAMVGDDIVSQRYISDKETTVIDDLKGEGDARHIFIMNESTEYDYKMTVDLDFAVWNDTTYKGTIKFDDGYMDKYDMTVDVNAPENEPFATTGRIEVVNTFEDEEYMRVVLTFNPEKNGNKIVMEYKVDFDDEIEKITVNFLLSEGTGVEAPKDVEPTDISDYTPEQIAEIFENMAGQLEDVFTDMLF
jgi:uncharacterized Zn finger protein (UPF0148 family)